MEFSEQYLALLKDFKGFYAKPYVCTGGAGVGYQNQNGKAGGKGSINLVKIYQ